MFIHCRHAPQKWQAVCIYIDSTFGSFEDPANGCPVSNAGAKEHAAAAQPEPAVTQPAAD
ncbi:hypothetical protein OH687_34195 [Burkholderia anthina]|nr:hypothetical protein OH687_34195 [Burkholderia anthina]